MPYEKHQQKRLKFAFEPGRAFMVQNEKRYEIIKGGIIANGTRDLCLSEDANGEITISKTEETDPEKIVILPENDIIHLEFENHVPDIGLTIFFEITDNLIPTAKDFLKYMKSFKREHYDAFIGREYTEL